MGSAKNAALERQGEDGTIVQMLLEEGGISECLIHVDVYIDAEDQEADERVAREWADTNDIDFETASERVQTAKAGGEVYDECPYCSRNAHSG